MYICVLVLSIIIEIFVDHWTLAEISTNNISFPLRCGSRSADPLPNPNPTYNNNKKFLLNFFFKRSIT